LQDNGDNRFDAKQQISFQQFVSKSKSVRSVKIGFVVAKPQLSREDCVVFLCIYKLSIKTAPLLLGSVSVHFRRMECALPRNVL